MNGTTAADDESAAFDVSGVGDTVIATFPLHTSFDAISPDGPGMELWQFAQGLSAH